MILIMYTHIAKILPYNPQPQFPRIMVFLKNLPSCIFGKSPLDQGLPCCEEHCGSSTLNLRFCPPSLFSQWLRERVGRGPIGFLALWPPMPLCRSDLLLLVIREVCGSTAW